METPVVVFYEMMKMLSLGNQGTRTNQLADATQSDYDSAAAVRSSLRRFRKQTELVTRKHGLTPDQFELLLEIKVSPEQRRTIGHLCENLVRRQSAVTQLARRAENLGLLDRKLSKKDARVRYLALSPEGERRLAATVADLGPERARLLTLLNQAGVDAHG